MLKETLRPQIELGDYALSISKGGTENMTPEEVAKRFNYIRKSLLGQPNGYVQLNENNKIPLEVLDV